MNVFSIVCHFCAGIKAQYRLQNAVNYLYDTIEKNGIFIVMNYKKTVAEQECIKEWYRADNGQLAARRAEMWRIWAGFWRMVGAVCTVGYMVILGFFAVAIALCTGQANRLGKR